MARTMKRREIIAVVWFPVGAVETPKPPCDNEDQYQQCEDREELLGSFSHGIADDLTYGFSVVAKGCEQGTEVLQAAKEDSADDAP